MDHLDGRALRKDYSFMNNGFFTAEMYKKMYPNWMDGHFLKVGVLLGKAQSCV